MRVLHDCLIYSYRNGFRSFSGGVRSFLDPSLSQSSLGWVPGALRGPLCSSQLSWVGAGGPSGLFVLLLAGSGGLLLGCVLLSITQPLSSLVIGGA